MADHDPTNAPLPAPLQDVRVLVIEDDRDTLEAIVYAVRRMGGEVMGAASGQEAIDNLQAFAPQVILSDILLPSVDGYSIIRYLRRFGMKAPAIALSCLNSPEDRFRSAQAGFDLHLPKPLDPDVLQRAICTLLGRGEASA